MKLCRPDAIVLLSLWVSAAPVLGLGLAVGVMAASEPSAPKLVWSLRSDDLREVWRDAAPAAFDLSPDGGTLAAGFTAREGARSWGVWVGEWNIATGRILRQWRVDGPGAHEAIYDLRFTPDGRGLVALTSDVALLLSATSLAVEGRTSLDSKASPSGPSRQRSMAISADGRWAVVLSRAGGSLDCSSSEVVLIQFGTGELVARWRPNPPCAKFISLSPDGRTVLLSRFAPAGPPSGDIVSVDAHTGEALRWFNSGFRGVNGGAWSAVFTGREQFVAAPAMWNAHPGDSGKALKVFDEQPGGVVRELTYRQFGSLGIVATSWDAPIVAMINYWLTPLENMLGDDFHPKHGVDLLLYRLAESQPFSVLRHLRVGQLGGGPDSYRPRLSANGSRVAIFQQGNINVYSVPSPEGL